MFIVGLLGCGSGGGDEGTGTGTGGATTGGAGSTTGSASEVTTGSSGGTVTPTSDGTAEVTTGSTGAVGTSTGDGSSSGGGSSSGSSSSSGGDEVVMGFFVTSDTRPTGDLGGLEGADKRCQDLADAVGAGDRTWQAYLSAEHGPDDGPVDARDRIGSGPWYNAKLVMIASDVDDLHTKDGDHELFLDENGAMINGQWGGSPAPNQHDILTGTNKDGTVAVGKTCLDWTSDDANLFAQVGHSDGLGPNMDDSPNFRPWNSVHESGGCNDTAPKGGAGKIYCFAID